MIKNVFKKSKGTYGYRRITEDLKIEYGISKIKEMIKNNNILEGFDEEVFKSLVDYIIIGGYDNGKITEYMIRFICKIKFNFTNHS